MPFLRFCGKEIPRSINVTESNFQVSLASDTTDLSQAFQCKVKCAEERIKVDKRSLIQSYEVTPCGAVENLSEKVFGEAIRLRSHPGFDGTSHYEDSTDCSFNLEVKYILLSFERKQDLWVLVCFVIWKNIFTSYMQSLLLLNNEDLFKKVGCIKEGFTNSTKDNSRLISICKMMIRSPVQTCLKYILVTAPKKQTKWKIRIFKKINVIISSTFIYFYTNHSSRWVTFAKRWQFSVHPSSFSATKQYAWIGWP